MRRTRGRIRLVLLGSAILSACHSSPPLQVAPLTLPPSLEGPGLSFFETSDGACHWKKVSFTDWKATTLYTFPGVCSPVYRSYFAPGGRRVVIGSEAGPGVPSLEDRAYLADFDARTMTVLPPPPGGASWSNASVDDAGRPLALETETTPGNGPDCRP